MLDEADSQRIFEEEITPVLFSGAPSDAPSLTLAIAQPGAAANRAADLLEDASSTTTLTARDLAAFHPRYEELRRSRSPEAVGVLNAATTAWMRTGLQYALATRRSLLLDGGGFTSVDIALATAGLFAQIGFTTQVSVLGVPRSESLLAAASKYLLDTRAGRPAQLVTIGLHDAGLAYVRNIVQAVQDGADVDRLTIVGGDGSVRFDRARSDLGGFVGASTALAQAQATPLASAHARRWLTELRATTDYALAQGQIPRPLAEVLVELHQIGFSSVVPTIPLPKLSRARPMVEAALGEQLVALRQATQPDRRIVAPTGPVIAPPAPDIGISR